MKFSSSQEPRFAGDQPYQTIHLPNSGRQHVGNVLTARAARSSFELPNPQDIVAMDADDSLVVIESNHVTKLADQKLATKQSGRSAAGAS